MRGNDLDAFFFSPPDVNLTLTSNRTVHDWGSTHGTPVMHPWFTVHREGVFVNFFYIRMLSECSCVSDVSSDGQLHTQTWR